MSRERKSRHERQRDRDKRVCVRVRVMTTFVVSTEIRLMIKSNQTKSNRKSKFIHLNANRILLEFKSQLNVKVGEFEPEITGCDQIRPGSSFGNQPPRFLYRKHVNDICKRAIFIIIIIIILRFLIPYDISIFLQNDSGQGY